MALKFVKKEAGGISEQSDTVEISKVTMSAGRDIGISNYSRLKELMPYVRKHYDAKDENGKSRTTMQNLSMALLENSQGAGIVEKYEEFMNEWKKVETLNSEIFSAENMAGALGMEIKEFSEKTGIVASANTNEEEPSEDESEDESEEEE